MENIKNNNLHEELDKIYGNINQDNKIANTQLFDSKISKNVISSEERELCIFLYTIFQFYIEKASQLMNNEEQEKKDKAIKILKSLLENSFIQHFKSNKIIYACLNGILNFYLGLANFSAEDQTISAGPLIKALDSFNTLPTAIKIRYINIYQEIYNNLGIIFYNKGEIKKGLQYLGKAEQMYKVFNDLNGFNYTNNFTKFMQNCCKLDADDVNNNSIEFFNFYIDGGLNKKSFEHNYTLTIFYYAQAFTKLGFRKKAIKYCSLTLKRQIEFNEYDLKDTIVNCINLAQFYMENQHYAQAEYILISAVSLLPSDEKVKKRLRAAVQNQLGKYFLERLRFSVKQIKEQLWINENDELFTIVNKRIFTFNTLNIIWPKIEDVKDIEQAKLLFRLANTQYKRALEYYQLDGHVTEHIDISKDISQLYKYLTFYETDNKRIFAMIERRINLLEPILNTINHKVFIMQWQELSLELAEIYTDLFESNYELIRIKQKNVKGKELNEINEHGEKAIYHYKDIIDYIVQEYNKSAEKTLEDFVTVITIKFNMARILSKIAYKETKKRINSMTESLKLYEEVLQLLKGSEFIRENVQLQEYRSICEEMVNLLPHKITKINLGEEI